MIEVTEGLSAGLEEEALRRDAMLSMSILVSLSQSM